MIIADPNARIRADKDCNSALACPRLTDQKIRKFQQADRALTVNNRDEEGVVHAGTLQELGNAPSSTVVAAALESGQQLRYGEKKTSYPRAQTHLRAHR